MARAQLSPPDTVPPLTDTVELTVVGNDASGRIHLGPFKADLSIHFEQASGLTPDALAVSARVVSPLDAGILSRLPPGLGITLGFPVLLRIEPLPDGGLSFRGVTTIGLHTHDLEYVPSSRLVLFSSHQGGPFRDVTRFAGAGSYRVDGSSGTFSEFLIVPDVRPVDAIIAEKYAALQQTLDAVAGSLPPPVVADLQARLADALALFQAGQTADALVALDGFTEAVLAGSGTSIPDVWSADGSTVNAAGLLRAAADTLRFSLDWKETHS